MDFQPQRKVDDTVDKTVTRTEQWQGLRKLLESLDATKGAGSDDIAPVFWKRAVSSIAEPLTKIFTRSLATCTFAEEWKRICIVPIFKSGMRVVMSWEAAGEDHVRSPY